MGVKNRSVSKRVCQMDLKCSTNHVIRSRYCLLDNSLLEPLKPFVPTNRKLRILTVYNTIIRKLLVYTLRSHCFQISEKSNFKSNQKSRA